MSETHHQRSLFGDTHRPPVHFDGETYEARRDHRRLTSQLVIIADLMSAGDWWTLDELKRACIARYGKHYGEAGISARIRDLRKPKFGASEVESRRHPDANGLWQYRITPRRNDQ